MVELKWTLCLQVGPQLDFVYFYFGSIKILCPHKYKTHKMGLGLYRTACSSEALSLMIDVFSYATFQVSLIKLVMLMADTLSTTLVRLFNKASILMDCCF